ncbi:hypothetical protein HG535_0A03080 [Zygotorulaspora mrakii]|uniref:Protein ECM3 n=1 Tax=Zygotorulaspora mrakii TaxID=42260 RepID=A0A7H9AX60_ZYGMR|nr:uncharacterized protein HG535_0A03080 [Zygotorulaspora mrakii]QLG70369.1 hypothetical protein HG535_0A03080 [Zygotorulaspora mrakii]
MSIPLGAVIWSSFKPIIKIYLIIGTGFLLARVGILSVQATRSISDIVLTLLLPCLSFNKIVGNIEDRDIKTVGIICLTSVLLFGTGLFFAYVIRRTMPVPRQWYGGILAGGMFPNISDLPIAYIQTMDQGFIFQPEEGDKGVACVIIFMAMFMLCVFNLGGFRLIESDFHYKDIESAVTPEENDSLKNEQEGQELEQGGPTHQPQRTDDSSILSSSSIIKPEKAITRSWDNESSSSSRPNPSSISLAYDDDGTENHERGNKDAPGNMWDYITTRKTQSQPVAYTADESQNQQRQIRVRRPSIRSIDLRDLPSENVTELIREYSNVNQYGRPRRNSALSDGDLDVALDEDEPLRYIPSSTSGSLINRNKSNLTKILTSDATVNTQDIRTSGSSLPSVLKKFPLTPFIVFFLKNCLRPASMALILALTIAFIPWVKALFVTTSSTPNLNQAPDQQPALSFVMDYTNYIGAASVPFGLLLLGATLGRLKLTKLYPGFWKSALTLVVLRMCIMPIFGVLWCDRLVKAGWVNWDDDKMLLFVIAIDWALPSMTTMIYFTASYTPPDSTDTIQMDCTSFFLMIQYPIMVVSLPFLVSYFLKVQMKI